MLNVAFRSEYFQYANPPYRAQMPAAKTVMTTALRCTPNAKSRRVPSNKHRKAVAPPITVKAKSTQLSIIAGHLTPMVPGAVVEPACRNYPARDFKSKDAPSTRLLLHARKSRAASANTAICCSNCAKIVPWEDQCPVKAF